MRLKTIALETNDGRPIAREVRIADTFHARTLGLLRHESLNAEQGLLLIPGGSVHTIGMRFAIDVVFLDRRLRVLNFFPHVPPRRFRLAPPHTTHVLELRAGRVRETGLLIGHYLRVVHEDEDQHGSPPALHSYRTRQEPCARQPLQFSLHWPPHRCTQAALRMHVRPVRGGEHTASGAVR